MKRGLRVHIATVGFQVRRITEPLIRDKANRVYLLTRSHKHKATPYLDKVMKTLRKERYLQIEKRAMDIDCLKTYKKIIKEEEEKEEKIPTFTSMYLLEVKYHL